MPYIPDPLDDTKPIGSDLALAAVEFRALKTKLKAHETAVVTTLPDAITAVTADLAALTVRKRIQLTGSGNFTVPAGITTLWVTAVGGHRPVGTWGITGTYTFYYNYIRSGGIAPTLRKRLTVTPGQVIAYALGANEVLVSTGVGQYPATISQVSAAAATTFGDLVAPVASVEHKLAVANSVSYTVSGGGNEQLLYITHPYNNQPVAPAYMRADFTLPITVTYSVPNNDMAVPADFTPLLIIEY